MTKTKKEWVELFNSWVDLAMTLEKGGCRTRYSFSIYSGDGDYVSLSFKYGDVEVDQNYNSEATQEDIEALENAFKVAKEKTMEALKEDLEEYTKRLEDISIAYNDCAKLLVYLGEE